jgi:hypothetical protein
MKFSVTTHGKIIGSKELLRQALLTERYLELNPSNSLEGHSESRSKSRARSPSRKAEKLSHSDSPRSRKDVKKGSTPCPRLSSSTNRKTPQPESHSSRNKDRSTSHRRNFRSSAPTSMAKMSNTCYHCGGMGHKIAQCPNPDTRGISAKAMRIKLDVSSDEGSDGESFYESPVEASSDERLSGDEGSESSGPSNGDRHNSGASSNYSTDSLGYDGSDGSEMETEGGDASSPSATNSEGEESNDSSSEDSEGSNDHTGESYLSFNPGMDSSIYDDKTIQSTLAPMFAQTSGEADTKISSKDGEHQNHPAEEARWSQEEPQFH